MYKSIMRMVTIGTVILMSSVAAHAADGQVSFNGEVIENSCQVVQKNKVVTLPTVQRSALDAAGATAGVVPFTIDLTGCTAGSNVSVYFEKDSVVSSDGRLLNNVDTSGGDTAAGNVEVELMNNNFGFINLATQPAINTDGTVSGSAVPVSTADSSGDASLPFYARYYATGASTAGKVNTYVNFTVVYP